MTKEFSIAFNRCSSNGIRIYPITIVQYQLDQLELWFESNEHLEGSDEWKKKKKEEKHINLYKIQSVYKVQTKGKMKIVKPKVMLVVDYGNGKKVYSQETYTQEEDMTMKIIELYKIINSKI